MNRYSKILHHISPSKKSETPSNPFVRKRTYEEYEAEQKGTEVERLQEKIKELQKNVEYLRGYVANQYEEISELKEEIKVQVDLSEGLLNEPPEVKNSDPLTPLNQQFVTLSQLSDHYQLFINRISQQLATLGGGGETQLRYLDDIVGIATNPSVYDGKYLRYIHSSGKFEFTEVSGSGGGDSYWSSNASGIHTLSNVAIGTDVASSSLTISGDTYVSGVSTSSRVIVNDLVRFTDANISIGDTFSGYSIAGGYENVFVGLSAGKNTNIGSSNNFFGASSGYTNTMGSNNNFIGPASGYSNLLGFNNNFFGYSCGYNNTEGYYNNFMGDSAGYHNTFGNFNNFFGKNAGYNNQTGSYNVAIGYNVNLPILNGDNQLVLGKNSDFWIVGNSSFNIGIGTTNPSSKLTVGGDVRVGVDTSQGIILTDSNGVSRRVILNTDGTLATVPI